MDNRILEIVFYLMDYLHENHEQASSISDVSLDLKGLGYSDEEITRAYYWILDHLQGASERLYSSFPGECRSTRILTDLERSYLSAEAHGFLIKLAGINVIDSEQFESVLDRVALFGQHPVSLEQLKFIVTLVAFGAHTDIDNRVLLDDESDPPACVN